MPAVLWFQMSNCKFISRKQGLHAVIAVYQSAWHLLTFTFVISCPISWWWWGRFASQRWDPLPQSRYRWLALMTTNSTGLHGLHAVVYAGLGPSAVICCPATVKSALGGRRSPQRPFQRKRTRRWRQIQGVIKYDSVSKRFLSFRLLLTTVLFWKFQHALIFPPCKETSGWTLCHDLYTLQQTS